MEGDFPSVEEMEARLAKAEAELEARRRAPGAITATGAPVEVSPAAAPGEAENWLLKSVGAGNVLAFEWDMVSDRLIRSENADRFLGYADAQVSTGTAFFKMIVPEDRTRLLHVLATLRKRGGSYVETYRLRLQDGSIIWVEDSASAEFDDSGKPVRLNGVLSDITERRRAEEDARRLLDEIQQGKEKLSALVNSICDEVWFVDSNKQFSLANASALREFGLGSINGLDVEKLAHSLEVLDAAGNPRALDEAPPLRALRGEVVKNLEEIVRNPGTGQLRHRQVSSAPVKDAAGNIIGAVSVVRDITEAREAQEALRQSEETLEAFFSASPGILNIEDEEFRFLKTDRITPTYFGLDCQTIVGKSLKELSPEFFKSQGPLMKRVLKTGKPELNVEVQSPIHSRPGEIATWRASYFPVPLGKGKRGLGIVGVEISDLKRADAALRESEGRYHALFSEINEGFALHEMLYDRKGEPCDYRFLEVNPAFERLTGLKREAMIGRTMREVLPEEDTGWIKIYGEVARTGKETRFDKHSPSLGRHYEVLAYRPSPNRFAVLFLDITERARAARQLEEAKRLLDALMEHVPEGITIADAPDGRIRMVSRYGKDALGARHDGMTAEEVVGLWTVYQPDGTTRMPVSELPLNRALSAGEAIENMELIMANAKGKKMTLLCNAAPIRGANSEILGSIVAWRDITELKQAGEALKQAHDELEQKVAERTVELQRVNRILRTISECNQALVHATNELELIETVCRTITEASGYRMAWVGFVEQDHAQSIRPVCSVGFADGYLDRARISWGDNMYGHGPTGSAVRSAKCAIGRDFLNDASLAPWREEALRSGFRSSIALPLADAQGVFGVLTIYASEPEAFDEKRAEMLQELADDLAFGIMSLRTRSERDQVLQALEQKNAQLRALTTELTRAEEQERRRLAQLLHDHLQQLLVGARYSLAAVRSSRDVTKNELSQKTLKRVDEFLGEAVEASRSLTYELSPPILYQEGLAEALKWLCQQFREQHHLKVRLILDEPPAVLDENIRIVVFRATRELLFNIVKHADVKNALVRMRIDNGDHLQLVVSDKGVGFDTARVLTSPDATGGFGLFSLRQRLELLGGRLDIQSQPGRGSTFTVRIPLGKPPEKATPEPAPAAARKIPTKKTVRVSPRSRKIRVLLADDHAVMRDGLARLLLEETDLDVVGQAADGHQAIELAKRLKPDVVLMDVSMPKLDGIEATRLLVSELPNVRVIGLSMFEDEVRSSEMLKAGAVAYLQKSGRSQDLISAIRSHRRAIKPARVASTAKTQEGTPSAPKKTIRKTGKAPTSAIKKKNRS